MDIARDDPARADVAALIALHRSEALASTPRDNAHVMDAHTLADPRVTSASSVDGPVFGGYPPSAHNRFMTMVL